VSTSRLGRRGRRSHALGFLLFLGRPLHFHFRAELYSFRFERTVFAFPIGAAHGFIRCDVDHGRRISILRDHGTIRDLEDARSCLPGDGEGFRALIDGRDGAVEWQRPRFLFHGSGW
jgi:hypothetical protein